MASLGVGRMPAQTGHCEQGGPACSHPSDRRGAAYWALRQGPQWDGPPWDRAQPPRKPRRPSLSGGGRIVASMDLQPRSLDPIMGDAPTSDRYVLIQIFQSLVRFDDTGKLVPWLAESWEYADRNSSLLFRLRQGIKFHDGTDFDAEAVAYNVRRTIDPATNAPRSPDLSDVAGVT